jgi:hypothetical protein
MQSVDKAWVRGRRVARFESRPADGGIVSGKGVSVWGDLLAKGGAQVEGKELNGHEDYPALGANKPIKRNKQEGKSMSSGQMPGVDESRDSGEEGVKPRSAQNKSRPRTGRRKYVRLDGSA